MLLSQCVSNSLVEFTCDCRPKIHSPSCAVLAHSYSFAEAYDCSSAQAYAQGLNNSRPMHMEENQDLIYYVHATSKGL